MLTTFSEYGLPITVPDDIPGIEITCLQFPYTSDVCFHSLLLTGSMEKAFAHCKIFDPEIKTKIGTAVEIYLQAGEGLPTQTTEMAMSTHLLDDSIGNNVELYMVSHIRGDRTGYFFYSTAPLGETPQKDIPCPSVITPDMKTIWEEAKPKMICVMVDRVAKLWAIAMEDCGFPYRTYSIEQVNEAKLKLIERMNGPQDQTQPMKRIPLRNRFIPESEKKPRI